MDQLNDLDGTSSTMDKLKLRGLNLGQVFNYRCICIDKYTNIRKQPNLKLKTRPKPVLGSLMLAFVLPGSTIVMISKQIWIKISQQRANVKMKEKTIRSHNFFLFIH